MSITGTCVKNAQCFALNLFVDEKSSPRCTHLPISMAEEKLKLIFGVKSDHIPCTDNGSISLSTIPSYYNTFTKDVCPLYQGQPISWYPNMNIGRYGHSGRLNVSMILIL